MAVEKHNSMARAGGWFLAAALTLSGHPAQAEYSNMIHHIGLDVWRPESEAQPGAVAKDASAPFAETMSLTPGVKIARAFSLAGMTQGCYRLTYYFRLNEAAGTQIDIGASVFGNPTPTTHSQPVYTTQPANQGYLALPLNVVVTQADSRLWLWVKFSDEPEPRRSGLPVNPRATARFGGIRVDPASSAMTIPPRPLAISMGEFRPTKFPKCWPFVRIFRDGTALLGSSNDPNAGWHTSSNLTDWHAITLRESLSTMIERQGKGILALRWQNMGDDPAAIPGIRYRADSGKVWAEGKITADPITYNVPLASGGTGEGASYKLGCWVEKSIVELKDGSLLATAYGWFKGQADLVNTNNPKGDHRYTTWFIRSADDGKSWTYQGQAPYHKTRGGQEGLCEPSLIRFPDTGELLCMMRTGSGFPLYQSRSTDDGRTWDAPQPVVAAMNGDFVDPGTMRGVWPSLVLMRSGVLACSWGRTPPGVHVAFSIDRGRTWGQATTLTDQSMSSYINMQEIRPGVLLMLYDNNDVLGFQEITVKPVTL